MNLFLTENEGYKRLIYNHTLIFVLQSLSDIRCRSLTAIQKNRPKHDCSTKDKALLVVTYMLLFTRDRTIVLLYY